MKESNYNFYIEDNERNYVYNILNNTLCQVEKEKIILLKSMQLSKFKKEEMLFLEENGIIIKDEIDEINILKERNLRGKYSNDIMSLTIVPSLLCNFRCIYCYQEVNSTIMSKEVENEIINFIYQEASKVKTLEITWFGGEPLLQIDLIERMSLKIIDFCKKEKIYYNASIITNGYLVDSKMAERLKSINVIDAQITIDGPAEIHNKRRKYLDKTINTYEKCIDAIRNLRNAGIYTNIRVNIDQRNADSIEELLKDLMERNLTGINVSLEKVSEFTSTCADTDHSYFTSEEMNNLIPKLSDQLVDFQLYEDENDFYPRLKYNYCGACQLGSLTIGPLGELYKCWCDLGDLNKSFANIAEYDINGDFSIKENMYISYNPFNKAKCVKCKLMPLCMGGCPRNGLSGEVNCIINEEYLRNKILNYLKVVNIND